ncbi:phosphoenolpyruvate-protein phosphotransferase [Halobacteroides halobius DSM 5150]|uniref:Phosphoenolpyruvate-protein phosphotransferase n=1 Tax=Halobacteroides halobius (strain ATCC 35273 / DSM 5150 / MD-1) TaxID=748449 RepID=L0KEC5_HALHC|nr:phosphoenolpyruvate--protein phosphotransferase [Halobacteroides halobius]AGB42413.1 phosphoenolpyruvate-protein phosphotransferase [Halobacteroides halobius DSM 5150]
MSQQLTGVAASPGIVTGEVMLLEEEDLSYETVNVEDTDGEKERLHDAIQESKEQLQAIKDKVEDDMGQDKAEIFQAHLMVVEDPELISAVEDKIDSEEINVEAALEQTVEQFATMFSNMDDEYMRERASDIRDVGTRILRNLLGVENMSLAELDREVILVAEDLTPSDTAQVDKDKVLGFATKVGGRTSHTAIMARSLEIPAVVGASQILDKVENGMEIIVDGVNGDVIIEPTADELTNYQKKAQEYRERRKRLAQLKEEPAETKDGHQVELVANIGTPNDVAGALDKGAEGIGLYRSEFLYMDRDSLPTEKEQFEAYKEVAEKMDGPIVIRTLDIGGDKELSYLDLPEEMNPFLGYRAIRICLDKTDIFKTQLRAILKASAYGQVKIMYPMISAVEQLRAANQILEEVKSDLSKEGIEFDQDLEVGMMIEVPAAAMTADILAKETDFFSIGTNDLIQYTTATDRMNENIAHLYQPFHPALLRLIKRVVKAAHNEGNWAGMCGEMAGDKRLTPFLLGIGLDEFSMSAVTIPEVKDAIRNLTLEEAEKIADEAIGYSTAEEIENYLSQQV